MSAGLAQSVLKPFRALLRCSNDVENHGGQTLTDERSPGPGAGHVRDSTRGADEEVRTLQEEQAIAAAMMLGDRIRREDRVQVYFYAQRIGMFGAVLAFMGMIMLFGYTRLTQGEFNPTPGMLLLGFFMAGGASVSYWAHAQARHSKEE